MLRNLFGNKPNSGFKVVRAKEMKSSACCCYGWDWDWDR